MRNFANPVKYYRRIRASQGFALPAVIIISVITLSALVMAMSTVTVTRGVLSDQYYNRLAREAAVSGVDRATACIKGSLNVAAWDVEGRTLSAGDNCDGTNNSSAPNYIVDTGSIRTSFEVGSAETDAGFISISAEGTAELLRSSDGATWREYQVTVSRKISVGDLVSTNTSTGNGVVCGILSSQTWCWGRNAYGQLGNNDTDDSNVPVRVERRSGGLLGRYDSHVAAGYNFACNVSDNEVYCWGRNHRGQLGDGSRTTSRVPVKVDTSTGLGGGTITGVVAGEETACAIASGDVYCWGDSTFGQLGIGLDNTYRSSPVRVNGIGAHAGLPVTDISATPNTATICAIADGRAYCWGSNEDGQVGNGTFTNALTPVAVNTASGLGSRTVTDIAVASRGYGDGMYGHACAVAGGDVFCWGNNEFYKVNPAPDDYFTTPVRMTSTLPTGQMTHVGVGMTMTCAMATGDRVWCWGYNHRGELGDGTNTSRRYPTPILVAGTPLEGKQFDSLMVGVLRGCVLAEGRTYCWGNNEGGQLGDGTNISRNRAVESIFLRNTLPHITY